MMWIAALARPITQCPPESKCDLVAPSRHDRPCSRSRLELKPQEGLVERRSATNGHVKLCAHSRLAERDQLGAAQHKSACPGRTRRRAFGCGQGLAEDCERLIDTSTGRWWHVGSIVQQEENMRKPWIVLASLMFVSAIAMVPNHAGATRVSPGGLLGTVKAARSGDVVACVKRRVCPGGSSIRGCVWVC